MNRYELMEIFELGSAEELIEGPKVTWIDEIGGLLGTLPETVKDE